MGRARREDNQKRLGLLAEFGPIFRNPKTVFGKWHPMSGEGTASEPATLPWFELSEAGHNFCEMATRSGWILGNFDWPKWADSVEGRYLLGGLDPVLTADCEQLAKLLTALVRSDRFNKGALASAFDSGLLLSIAERAEMLSGEMSKSE